MGRTIFKDGKLFDGEKLVERATVVVEGDRIASVATGNDTPILEPADRVIDMRGKTLMPGMVSGHWHGDYGDLRLAEIGRNYLNLRRPPPYLSVIAAKNLRNAVISGFTSVVGAGCSYDIDASLKRAIADGWIEGPRIRACGAHLNTTGNTNDVSEWWYNVGDPPKDELHQIAGEMFCDGPDGFRKAVRHQMRRGVEVIKIFPTGGHGFEVDPVHRDMLPDELDMVIRTAHAHGAIVRGHTVGKAAILEAVAAGIDIIDHGDQIDEEVIAAMVAKGTFFVPSMLYLKKLVASGVGEFATAGQLAPMRRNYENLRTMLPKAARAGVKIVPGDDYGMEFMPHAPGLYAEELEIYVKECGIDAREVLKWTTVNGAQMMNMANEAGKIEAGRLADLLIVDGNPCDDITLLRNPEENLGMVMIGGKALVDKVASRKTPTRLAS